MKSLRIGLFFLLLSVTASGTAQDYSQMSDDALEKEWRRLQSHQYSNSQRRGWRNRVTASDYELEFQMQQLDKLMEQDTRARQQAIEDERVRRMNAADRARREQRVADYKASSEESHQAIMGRIASSRERLNQDQARLEQQRQRNEQLAAQNRQRSLTGAAQAEAFYQRSRTRPAPQPVVRPVQQPAYTGPSFRIPQPDYDAHRRLPRHERETPLQAFERGQRAGDDLVSIFKALRDGGRQKRKERIVQKWTDGTITAADYRQLVKDGYTDKAKELLTLQQIIDESTPVE